MRFKSLALLTILAVCLSGCASDSVLLPIAAAASSPKSTAGEDGQPRDANGVIVPEPPIDIHLKPGESDPTLAIEGSNRVISSWAKADVEQMIAKGLVPDRLQKDYKKSIKREEFAELITMAAESLASDNTKMKLIANENKFADVEGMYHVEQAFSLGIINGVSAAKFEPDSNITRQEATTMMSNFLKTIRKQGLSSAEYDFVDKHSIASWAKDGVNILANAKVFQGSDLGFRPSDLYTREQAIITVKRLLDFTGTFEGVSVRGKVYVKLSNIDITKKGARGDDPTAPASNSMNLRSGVNYVKVGILDNKAYISDYADRLSDSLSQDTISKIQSGERKMTEGNLTIETLGSDYLIKITW
ncbi:S-layer homology domain-containing protein [Cohnella mopanensis]|uniref:S-layer homology domain-containing protein n=1 Tax=Cohnella mopanensis TaxID=2911966 RepID=UPI001EF94DD8|nr:S-layer homology domain-containing protein [Cohnella mopanensis]